MYESTADVVQLAWKVAANPTDSKSKSQLRAKCDKWSEQLDIVRVTVDKLVNPWSVSASCVVLAVTLKDQKLYTKQVKIGKSLNFDDQGRILRGRWSVTPPLLSQAASGRTEFIVNL